VEYLGAARGFQLAEKYQFIWLVCLCVIRSMNAALAEYFWKEEQEKKIHNDDVSETPTQLNMVNV